MGRPKERVGINPDNKMKNALYRKQPEAIRMRLSALALEHGGHPADYLDKLMQEATRKDSSTVPGDYW